MKDLKNIDTLEGWAKTMVRPTGYSPEGPGAVGDSEGGEAAVGLKAVEGPESEQLLSGSLSGSWLGGGAGCGKGRGCRG